MLSALATYSKLHRTVEPSAVVLEFTNICRIQCAELMGGGGGNISFPVVLKGIWIGYRDSNSK